MDIISFLNISSYFWKVYFQLPPQNGEGLKDFDKRRGGRVCARSPGSLMEPVEIDEGPTLPQRDGLQASGPVP